MIRLDHPGLPVSDWRIAHLGFQLEYEAAEVDSEGLGVAALEDDRASMRARG